jgi:hypothetical protein
MPARFGAGRHLRPVREFLDGWMQINLNSELTFRNSFLFPLQNSLARRDVLLGAVLVLVPLLGWLLNMGHRVEMVHKMHNGQGAWPSWNNYGRLLKSGTATFLGMIYYYLPGAILAAVSLDRHWKWAGIVATCLLLLATIAIPGYMTHYCREYDSREIFNPLRAFGRVLQGGKLYWKAWAIAISALALSFLGLLVFGVGFVVTSVWFWQVAGFSFASVFTQRFTLSEDARAASQT